MPIYTYRCENCGVQFDRRQHFNDEPLKICPECQTETLRKVYLPVGIVFKGTGFYATDNRSPSGQESRVTEEQVSGDSETSTTDKEPKKKSSKPDKTKAKSKKD
jgi:putative FmdB family regulatory protein